MRECSPVDRTEHFIRRYVLVHGDARESALAGPFRCRRHPPPYPGLIDHHEQHRYAYELLGLDAYVAAIADVLLNVRAALRPGARW